MSGGKKKSPIDWFMGMTAVSRVFLIGIFSALLVLTVLSIMDACGLAFTHPETRPVSAGLVVWLAIGWGLYALRGRFRNKTARTVAGVCVVLVMCVLFLFIFLYIAQYNAVTAAQPYNTIKTEGHTVVLMRRVDLGVTTEDAMNASLARMDARQAEYDAAHPDETHEEGDYGYDSYGYEYTAYPKVLGFFYKKNADTEGAIYRGVSSEAKLMYEWTDENTLRFYLEDPQTADEGEILLRW